MNKVFSFRITTLRSEVIDFTTSLNNYPILFAAKLKEDLDEVNSQSQTILTSLQTRTWIFILGICYLLVLSSIFMARYVRMKYF